MSNKGQIITYDFFIAMSIFFVVLIIIFSFWAYSLKEIEETRLKQMAFDNLLKASQIWFKEGYPKYWDVNNVIEIGLSNDGKINLTKVEMLNAIGYQKFLSLMNLGPYNIYYNLTGSSFTLEFGKSPKTANNIYRMERIGILGREIVKIQTVLWD